ncbi:U1 like C2H2 zinc finger [Cryptosporidium sp. chipmunk genotype I]|uniref:U1 like C2H2 zinc finger n=1 Tax=Cryptosporidium sp. chipmunk genotype I TaxID=1280935 RepID=UPI00351A0BB6|nr:U1 like C2H2 zinc finger [Cryptosporidium sp. chipmunk genotype I]
MSGVNSLGRKVWDKEFYSKSKEERDRIRSLENVNQEKKADKKEEISEEGAKKMREIYLDISKNIGVLKSHITGDDIKKNISGYWCEACKLGFNDSHSWIRHLNSQSHNQKMGTSLYVEKKSLESVKRRLSELIHDYDHGLGIFSKNNEGRSGVYEEVTGRNKGRNEEKISGEENELDDETRSHMLQYNFPSSFS